MKRVRKQVKVWVARRWGRWCVFPECPGEVFGVDFDDNRTQWFWDLAAETVPEQEILDRGLYKPRRWELIELVTTTEELADFSYPTCRMCEIWRLRFGVKVGEEVHFREVCRWIYQ